MWIRKSAVSLKKIIERFSRVCGVVSMVFLVIMMMLTVTDVLLRALFNTPVKGSLELTEYFMVITGFLGIAWCAVKRSHVKVDLILSHLPLRAQTIIDAFTLFLGMTVVPLVAWQGFAQVRRAYLEGAVSEALDIPNFPFYGIVGFGYGLMFLVLLIIFVELIQQAVKK